MRRMKPKSSYTEAINTKGEVKDAICTVSYRSGASVPKAWIVVQVVCEKLYKYKFLFNLKLKNHRSPSTRSKGQENSRIYTKMLYHQQKL